MLKLHIEASLASLSRDEMAKVIKDLAADPTIEERVATAVELSRVSQDTPLEF